MVDRPLDIDPYEAVLRDRGLALRYVIETHVHADHVSGARRLRDRVGREFCLHKAGSVAYPFRSLTEGEELPLGQLRLRVWHTPVVSLCQTFGARLEDRPWLKRLATLVDEGIW